MYKIQQITVVGLGMMGASLALAVREADFAAKIVGVDVDSETLRAARESNIVDVATDELATGVAGAELVVLATPVCMIAELLDRLNELHFSGVITDLGSTKGQICAKTKIYPQLTFIGSHPMTGSEIAGLVGADGRLFDRVPVIITACQDIRGAAMQTVTALWEKLNAKITFMDPAEHDYCAAIISHLPHATAVVTMNAASSMADGHPEIFALIAGGFRDVTRVAEGDPRLWRDIFLTNHTSILQAIATLKLQLAQLEAAVMSQDGEELMEIFSRAQISRKQLVKPKK